MGDMPMMESAPVRKRSGSAGCQGTPAWEPVLGRRAAPSVAGVLLPRGSRGATTGATGATGGRGCGAAGAMGAAGAWGAPSKRRVRLAGRMGVAAEMGAKRPLFRCEGRRARRAAQSASTLVSIASVPTQMAEVVRSTARRAPAPESSCTQSSSCPSALLVTARRPATSSVTMALPPAAKQAPQMASAWTMSRAS